MTNPKIKNSNKRSTEAVVNVQHQQNNDGTELMNVLHNSDDDVELNLDDYSFGGSSNSEDVDLEEDEASTCSSFSLQECINEFRARRIRRLSTQSREVTQIEDRANSNLPDKTEKKTQPDPADADLINQNRCNKEQERKCKPCRDGFCYCFTSDSGEGGGVCHAVTAGTRAGHVRQSRRHRRSDCQELGTLMPQSYVKPVDHINNRPVSFKVPTEKDAEALPQKQQNKERVKRNVTAETTSNANELTAISRLETSAPDAPLIHIIQELHNNCVISEVRVNKHKLQASRQQSQSLNTCQTAKSSPRKTKHSSHSTRNMCEPTAPPLENWAAVYKNAQRRMESFGAPVLDKIDELESISDIFAYSTPLTSSSKHTDSGRRKNKGGRLLQKRLSLSSVHYRPRRSLQAPPKPPRAHLCLEEKSTISSLSSTSPSLREAERILDEFLIRKGAMIKEKEEKAVKYTGKVDKAGQVEMEKVLYASDRRREHRKSCPTSLAEIKSRPHLPTCPSLSDLERSAMDSNKKYTNYEKNIRKITEKPVKELSFGWKEPKIAEMLNCDTTSKQKQFKSQAVQAEPQQIIGWQIPPKVDLDTVDGVCSNLASNIATKNTPVKSSHLSTPKRASESQKFIWREQWRNLSPWCNKSSKGGNRFLKSNLKSSSRSLLNSSKKKILRLVTPKRDNLQYRRSYTSQSVGVQTSQDELQPYEPSMTPQSPPGSYHSAVQTSTHTTTPTCSQNTNATETQDFDFTRTVRAPPKKAPRASIQRKLNFPFDGSAAAERAPREGDTLRTSMKTKTYRSYHGDLDQDVTLSKLGYILGNIRAKLEASDEHAMRTFQEIERREQSAVGYDCTDGPNRETETRANIQTKNHRSHQYNVCQQEPIYSEIEEDSMHITGTPHYDNTTSAKEIAPIKPDLEVLYAKVNKANKKQRNQKNQPLLQTTPIALGKLLHDSLRNLNTTIQPTQLPTLQEQSYSDTSYMSPPQPNASVSETSSMSHSQSMNNVRMQEHHSPPKYERNLNKSDLSLHRSEIFLDNLCRSELIVENDELECAGKMNNNDLNKSSSSLSQINTFRHFSTSTPTPDDSISYDTPNDADFDDISQAAISQLGLSMAIDSMTSAAPSAAKKKIAPKFTTKSHLSTPRTSSLNPSNDNALTSPSSSHQQSTSCPVTPKKLQLHFPAQLPHTSSLKELREMVEEKEEDQNRSISNTSTYDDIPQASSSADAPTTNNNFARYQRLKNALRKSFKRGTKFVKNETLRLSSSFSFPTTNISLSKSLNVHNQTDPQLSTISSSCDLNALFTLDEEAPVVQQLAQAVTICRQLPEVEISPEMVEAERLLLFSRLRRDAWPQRSPTVGTAAASQRAVDQHTHRFYIDGMRLPIKVDVNQDFFFNYFYIVTFECGGVIKSTQSAECHNGQAIFSECGIEFASGLSEEDAVVRCEIFMLRLRKVSTLSLEPKRTIVKLPTARTPGTASSSSSGDEIVSRFRLHASFALNARNFVPYEYVAGESKNTNKLCLRASNRNCQLPLTPRTKSTNLCTEIHLYGRAEIRFPKQTYSGFLNVQDPHTQHNWNRRWCTLDGIHIRIWTDENQMDDDKLLLTLDMRSNVQSIPLQVAPRELCARARAFCLQCALEKGGELVDTAAVFFAADTQEELEDWLVKLNEVLIFVDKWLCEAARDDFA